MSRQFGDTVVLIQRLPDGSHRRANAIVLASAVQPSNPHPRHALKDHRGVLPEGEHLDLIFPRLFPRGAAPRAHDLDVLFQRAVNVSQWREGAVIGWEPAIDEEDVKGLADAYSKLTEVSGARAAENELLKAQLAAALQAPVVSATPKSRPTIAELEAILAQDNDAVKVVINPDGSVTTIPDEHPGLPTSKDLDAVAADEQAKEATS